MAPRLTTALVFAWAAPTLAFLWLWGATEAGGDLLTVRDLVPWAIYTLGVFAAALVFHIAKSSFDTSILAPIFLLSGLGVALRYRLNIDDAFDPTALSNYVFPIGILALLGAYFLFRNGRYAWLSRFGWIYAIGSLGTVAALIAFGSRFRGAYYGPGLITPTEPVKLAIVALLASFLARHTEAFTSRRGRIRIPPLEVYMPILVFGGALAALFALQRDLGIIVILGFTTIAMVTLASGDLWRGVAAAGLLGVAWYYASPYFPHGVARIDIWQNPFADPTNRGWQILQSLTGLFAGGLWGAGLGVGEPNRIPTASSDFIYAAIGEELGFLGSALVIFIWFTFVARGFTAAKAVPDPFGRLLIAGLVTLFTVQSLLNIGGATKAIPLTGVTLPFLSHGGASLITSFTAVGLILAVNESRPKKTRKRTQRKKTTTAKKARSDSRI